MTLPDGRRFTIGADVDTASGTLDPFRRCMRLKGVLADDEEALLFDNGDLFLGDESFDGSGLYHSATRPAAIGPTRFGVPMERANAVATSAVFSPTGDGSHNVALTFADSVGFVGAARQDGELWRPLGYGLMTLPEIGRFAGKLADGRPQEGCLLRNEGFVEFWDGGKLARTVDGDGVHESPRAALVATDDDTIEYFDRSSGVTILWDRLSFLDTRVDHDRLAQWRASEVQRREREEIRARWAAEDEQRRAQREADQAAHQKEIDEYNAQVRAERLAAGLRWSADW